jgi:hypothetical protein
LALLAVAAAPARPAQAQEGDGALRRVMEAEQRLLRDELATYRQDRAGEAAARAALDQAVARAVARAAAGDAAGLAATLAGAEAALAAAERRTALALATLHQRLGRIEALAGALGAAPAPAVPDVLSGSWRLAIDPGALTGTMRLRQDGTQVMGTYRLSDGDAGSLRGTWIEEHLRLERVDAGGGFDAIFEAGLTAPGSLAGAWRPTILGTGGPGGGQWTATRADETPAGTAEEVETP